MRRFLKSLSRDERGVSALEYAILAAMIIGVVITALTAFGPSLKTAFEALGTKVETQVTGGTPAT